MNEILVEIGTAVLLIAGAGLISWLSRFFLVRVVKRITGRTETKFDDVILQAALFPVQGTIWVGGIELALNQLSVIPTSWQEPIDQLFFVIYAGFVFVFLFRLISGLVHWYGLEVAHKTETDLDDKFLDLFRRLALLILTATAIIIVLGRYGIEVSALVTTLGIGSLAIALAAQETLGDMFTGLTIMVDRPFQVGDRVELLDLNTWGDVTNIGLRSTRILTRDHRTVTVPNSVIGKGLIVNYSMPNTKYR
ncbi:MAG: mechanosensitive ion channel, partial [Chloroflexi bacterium]|nr:mechanosensitive ion channel [Chloroflexota bacterium]